jgi:hypothetical protein
MEETLLYQLELITRQRFDVPDNFTNNRLQIGEGLVVSTSSSSMLRRMHHQFVEGEFVRLGSLSFP